MTLNTEFYGSPVGEGYRKLWFDLELTLVVCDPQGGKDSGK